MQRFQHRAIWDAGCQVLRRPFDTGLTAFQSQLGALIQQRFASKVSAARANGPKNRPGRRLGAKKSGNEYVVTGNIIFRQRGTHWYPGENVGMGRDHTIFALECGYVKYYQDPLKHPKRQYIGIVLDKAQTLPAPLNAPRRRRLGMLTVPRKSIESGSHEKDAIGVVGNIADSKEPLLVGQAPASSTQPLTKKQVKEAKRQRLTGRLPPSELVMRSDYSYRETNWQIGRAAERAGVKVTRFDKKDRFLAWRRRKAAKDKRAEARSINKKKGKKDKPSRGGTRKKSAG